MPANRYTPLKENWMKIFTPVVEHLQLQIRFNLKTRNVEIKVKRAPSPAVPAEPREAAPLLTRVLGPPVKGSGGVPSSECSVALGKMETP